MARRLDDQISRGFDAGNYANAYETTSYYSAIRKLGKRRAKAYLAAFTLGFLSDRSDDELGHLAEEFIEAYALIGERARALGIAVHPYGLDGEETHTSTSYGVMPDKYLFGMAFDARCPDGTFSFGNDPYVGNDALNEAQLWIELCKQHAKWCEGLHAAECPGDGSCRGEGCPSEDAGSWCSSVLGILGFEWI